MFLGHFSSSFHSLLSLLALTKPKAHQKCLLHQLVTCIVRRLESVSLKEPSDYCRLTEILDYSSFSKDFELNRSLQIWQHP